MYPPLEDLVIVVEAVGWGSELVQHLNKLVIILRSNGLDAYHGQYGDDA